MNNIVRLIDADAFLEELKKTPELFKSAFTITSVYADESTVYKPVKHAKWIAEGLAIVQCSRCHNRFYLQLQPYVYCPGCGAKMDKGNNNED